MKAVALEVGWPSEEEVLRWAQLSLMAALLMMTEADPLRRLIRRLVAAKNLLQHRYRCWPDPQELT